uniref:Uncharacterized protein n=1 Tax=Strongyloides papillosus TaxID=174720 RepID=A0A0N5B653_STREA
MGIFKKIFSSGSKIIDKSTFQERVAFKFDKILKGEKVVAPKYETEKKVYEDIMKNDEIKKEIEIKHETLVENMNKFNIKSSEVIENSKSSRQLPTRETESEHKNDPTWEYFFYEPPKEQMLPNRLTLREALEFLRTKYETTQVKPGNQERLTELEKCLSEHDTAKRIDREKLDQIWKYFRPFARSDQQKVVKKSDLAYLQDVMHRKIDEKGFLDIGKQDPRTTKTVEGREKARLLEVEEIKKLENKNDKSQND